MTIAQFTPYRSRINDLALIQDRLNSIFHDLIPSAGDHETFASGSFVPPVDIYEDAQKVVLKLEVPGVRLEDFDVKIENQTLTIKGERKLEVEQKEENYHRIERRFGSFVRSFTLPQTVDTNTATAEYEAGVLTLSFSKKAEAKPKQVKVEVGSAKPKQVEAVAASAAA